MSGYTPPRWLERIVEWALPAGLSGQSALGDLAGQSVFRRSPGHVRLNDDEYATVLADMKMELQRLLDTTK